MGLEKSSDNTTKVKVAVKAPRKGGPVGSTNVKVYVQGKNDSMPEREDYGNRTVVRVSKERVRAAFKAASKKRG